MKIRDSCALVINSMALYNGLSTSNGMVAVYDGGRFIRTLYTDWTYPTKLALEESLKSNPNIEIQSTIYNKGIPSVHFCVPWKFGNKGLEQHLRNLGFKNSNYVEETKAANPYLDKFRDLNLLSRLNFNKELNLKYIPEMGRELASAITTRQVGITGDFSCLSSRGNTARNKLSIYSPLDMGKLKIKATVKYGDNVVKLVYINGKLRTLRLVDSEVPNSPPIMKIIPSLDSTGPEGELEVNALSIFEKSIDDTYKFTSTVDTEDHIYLGCPA